MSREIVDLTVAVVLGRLGCSGIAGAGAAVLAD